MRDNPIFSYSGVNVMSQLSFSDAEGQAKKRKVTRRENVSNTNGHAAPLERTWKTHCPLLQQIPARPKALSIVRYAAYSLQLFYNLFDPAMEDTLYEVQSMVWRCTSVWMIPWG